MSFGIYKNFTAIDIDTVHEKEITKKQIVDTNSIEGFVISFADEYFSWQQSQDYLDKRNEKLKSYLTEELQQLNNDMIRKDIATSSTVDKVQIWNVSEKGDNSFDVIFSVNQLITEKGRRGQCSNNLTERNLLMCYLNIDDKTIYIILLLMLKYNLAYKKIKI